MLQDFFLLLLCCTFLYIFEIIFTLFYVNISYVGDFVGYEIKRLICGFRQLSGHVLVCCHIKKKCKI